MEAVVMHEVKNYSQWKKAFDSHASFRKKWGATGEEHIFRDVDNPNMVVIKMEWDNRKNFEKFSQSDELKEVMEKAGVVSAPQALALEESKGWGMAAGCTYYPM